MPLGANTCRIQRLGDGFDGNAWVGGHPVSRREENHFSYVTVSADPDRNRPERRKLYDSLRVVGIVHRCLAAFTLINSSPSFRPRYVVSMRKLFNFNEMIAVSVILSKP